MKEERALYSSGAVRKKPAGAVGTSGDLEPSLFMKAAGGQWH